MTFGGQLARLIRQGQVFRFQPDAVFYPELVLRGVFRHPIQGCLGLFSALLRLFRPFFDSLVVGGRRGRWVQNG
jgi:hypothetical protein